MKKYLIAFHIPHRDLNRVATSIHCGNNMGEAIQEFKQFGRVFHEYQIIAITELDDTVSKNDLSDERVHSISYLRKHPEARK